MPVNRKTEKEAQKLLDSLEINSCPIPVDDIAKKNGITVMAFDLGADVSGALHIKKDSASIGYNPNESKVRQRFTIAHEIGHFILHRDTGDIFIDNENYYQYLKFRSSNRKLSEEDYGQEREANEFAAALLMPVELVKKEVKNYNGFDLSDSSMIIELAKKFEVSMPAMTYRILNLAESGLL